MSDVITVPHIDHSEKLIHFARWQDVEHIIENNKRLQTAPQRCDWGRHVASIPNVILEQWLNEEYRRGNVGLRPYTKEFDTIIEMKLRDPDWRWLRTDK
jgi:hypothetical protein